MKLRYFLLALAGLLATVLATAVILAVRQQHAPPPIPVFAVKQGGAAPKRKTAEQLENERLFFGHDDRQAVNAHLAPWRWVVHWETESGTECSGALVAPDIVISAAHCLLLERDIAFDFPDVVQIGYAGGQSLYTRQVATAWISPAFRRGLSYRRDGLYIQPSVAHLDVSFLKLKVPVPASYGHFAIAPGSRKEFIDLMASLGWRATQSGYPGDDDEHQHAHVGCTITRLNQNRTLSHRCDTLEGDSGSPIFATVRGVPTLLGVQSSAPPADQRDLDDNVAVAVPAWRELYENWLQRTGRH